MFRLGEITRQFPVAPVVSGQLLSIGVPYLLRNAEKKRKDTVWVSCWICKQEQWIPSPVIWQPHYLLLYYTNLNSWKFQFVKENVFCFSWKLCFYSTLFLFMTLQQLLLLHNQYTSDKSETIPEIIPVPVSTVPLIKTVPQLAQYSEPWLNHLTIPLS